MAHANLPGAPLSRKINTSVGFSGIPIQSPISHPLDITIGPLTTTTSFLLTNACAENLLGIDLLKKLHAHIFCSPEGVYITMTANCFSKCFLSKVLTEIPLDLQEVDAKVWATGINDVGKMCIDPVRIQLRPNAVMPPVAARASGWRSAAPRQICAPVAQL